MNEWKSTTIKESLKNAAIKYGYSIIDITKKVDSFGPTDLSDWMDTINGHSGGWYHRIKHGHDFAANIGDVYKKFGHKGVGSYPFELFKDFCTPAGIPVPGTQFLVKAKIVSVSKAAAWLSINAADVLTGGIALHSTYRLSKKAKSRNLKSGDILFASVGIGIKISAGVATTNPILIISAGADGYILLQNLDEVEEAFRTTKTILRSKTAKIAAIGASTGVAASSMTVAAAATFGTASTGTAISTLSGAALTKATFACLGYGSLAAGGLGIIGGMVVVGAVGVAAVAAGSVVANRCLN